MVFGDSAMRLRPAKPRALDQGPIVKETSRNAWTTGVTLARGACRARPGACDMVVSTAAHIRGRERLKTCPLVRPFPR